MTAGSVAGGIAAIRLISRDADALADFYRRLGFRVGGMGSPNDPFSGRLRRLVRLQLGHQRIEIAEPLERANPAQPVASGDLRFQHFCMVAPRMDVAMDLLDGIDGWAAITRGSPQRLPHRSGGVTAFKFRDPEGHPLEFLAFPSGDVPKRWREAAPDLDDPLIGIDHTAICVADTQASVEWYARFGFERVGGSVNEGVEQAHLDGVASPRVEVTTLRVPDVRPPHLELLCYDERPEAPVTDDADVIATRTVLRFPSSAPQRDPDGHRLMPSGDFS